MSIVCLVCLLTLIYSFLAGTKGGVSRSRSFQLTLRESIRHLRKRGSTIESKDQPKSPKPDEKADDVAKPDEEGKVEEGGKPEGGEKVEETKKLEEGGKSEETAGAGEGSEAAASQPEVVVAPQDGAATAGQPDLVAENKPSEVEEPKGEEKKLEETKPEASQTATADSTQLVFSVSFSKHASRF